MFVEICVDFICENEAGDDAGPPDALQSLHKAGGWRLEAGGDPMLGVD
jgi:hypothetical protein